MIYIIPDTNVYLHFTPIDQYPWFNHIDRSDTICIVFTHPIIDEIELKKYDGKQHIKDRAIFAIKLIEKYINEPEIKENLYCKFFEETITNEYISSLGLNTSDGDDKIIASIIKFKDLINSDDKIYFITNDLGPKVKAKKFKLDCFKPDANHFLPQPEDDFIKKFNFLKLENEKLKNLSPKLFLKFQNDSIAEKFIIQCNEEEKKNFINRMENENRNQYPKLESEFKNRMLPSFDELETMTDSKRKKRIQQLQLATGMNLTDINEYNSELDTYYWNYENYLNTLYEYISMKSLSLEINLKLINTGTIPAEDIDIYLHFPDGFLLYNDVDYPNEPFLPEPPKKRGIFSLLNPFNINFSIPRLDSQYQTEKPNISDPIIKKTNSYDVNIRVIKLNHNFEAKLKPMYIVFEKIEEVKNLKIKFEIRCANLPEIVNGNLNLQVSRK